MRFFWQKRETGGHELPEGVVGTPLPESFIHPRQHQEYLMSEGASGKFDLGIVGTPGCYGVRWYVGPVSFEHYTSDIAPDLAPTKDIRFVIWQPIIRTDIPKGWRRFFGGEQAFQMGVATITNPHAYWENWKGDARRNRSRFLKNEEYVIEKVSFGEYLPAYASVKKFSHLQKGVIARMKKKDEKFGKDVTYYVVRRVATKEIVSGLAVLDLPSISQSIHHNAFQQPGSGMSSLATGLVDQWFKHCIERNIRFLNFGIYWTPGNSPASWKGFSRFKGQFGVHIIRFPRALTRIVMSTKI